MEEEKKGFFSKLKDFFKPKEPTPEEKEEEKVILQEEIQQTHPTRELKECFYCKTWIQEGDRWSKQMNHWFHRPCYKKFLQAGKRGTL
jgi:hypothetical protein